MNLPDVTFLFQMFHFVVAYILLRRFVFAPALQIIEHDESRLEQAQSKVQAAQVGRDEMVQKKNRQWRFIQQSLSDMVPDTGQKICRKFFKSAESSEAIDTTLSSEQKKSIKKMLHDQLLDAGR